MFSLFSGMVQPFNGGQLVALRAASRFACLPASTAGAAANLADNAIFRLFHFSCFVLSKGVLTHKAA